MICDIQALPDMDLSAQILSLRVSHYRPGEVCIVTSNGLFLLNISRRLCQPVLSSPLFVTPFALGELATYFSDEGYQVAPFEQAPSKAAPSCLFYLRAESNCLVSVVCSLEGKESKRLQSDLQTRLSPHRAF